MFGEFLNIVVRSLKLDKTIYKDNKYSSNLVLVNNGVDSNDLYTLGDILYSLRSSNEIVIKIQTIDNGEFRISVTGSVNLQYKFSIGDVVNRIIENYAYETKHLREYINS